MTQAEQIPWFETSMGDREANAVAEVIASGYVNDGPRTRDLERRLAEFVGARYAVVTTSGTTAIALALMAHGIGPGDEVIVPDLTFIATATAVRLTGAEVVLVDVDEWDLNLSPASLGERLTPRTRAIVLVHLNGRCADVGGIRAVAGPDVVIVEDAAEALGCRSGERSLGTLADGSAVSFAPTKLITTGQGGAIFVDDESLHHRLVGLKDQGRDEREGFDHLSLGFNFKFTDVQAAIGIEQLAQLPRRLERQCAVFRAYRDGLSDIPQLTFPPIDFEDGAVPLWNDLLTDERDALQQRLSAAGIATRQFWPPVHSYPPFHDNGPFPVASSLASRGLWLPGGPGITDEQVERTIRAVRAFFS